MRVMVSRLFDPQAGKAEQLALIHAHDLDLNDRETLAEISLINPTLENAISHDIASGGQAIAEIMDANLGGTDAQDVCKLLLVASLANVPNAIVGLSMSEVISFLCAPDAMCRSCPRTFLAPCLPKPGISTPIAKACCISRTSRTWWRSSRPRQSPTTVNPPCRSCGASWGHFSPVLKDCYQEVLALPPMDDIHITSDRVSLVICEPCPGGGLHPDLRKFYEDLDYKNRILFLTGTRNILEALLETAAELKAIAHILAEMDTEKVPPTTRSASRRARCATKSPCGC